MKHTTGKCAVSFSGSDDFSFAVIAEDGGSICHVTKWSEDKANANLIAEAFNVANETGYTPRQLANQKAELLELLENIVDAQYDPKGSLASLNGAVREAREKIKKSIL